MSDTAIRSFDAWLSREIGPALRKHGFKKTASTFHLRGEEGWGVIQFQKSQWGTRDDVRFYLNVAVALDRLLSGQGRDPGRPPSASVCNWWTRIGHLTPDEQPEWFDFDKSTRVDALTSRVLPMLRDYALPFIEARITGPAFLDAMTRADRSAVIRPPRPAILAAFAAPSRT